MNAQTAMALARQQPFVQDFEPREIDVFASLAREVRFATDRVIYREGEECLDFYLVVSGRVVLEIAPPTGFFPVATVEPGEEFGWSALTMGHERVFQARALKDTFVLAFDAGKLREVCESDTSFGYDLMRKLLTTAAERLQAARLQLMDAHWPVAKQAGA